MEQRWESPQAASSGENRKKTSAARGLNTAAVIERPVSCRSLETAGQEAHIIISPLSITALHTGTCLGKDGQRSRTERPVFFIDFGRRAEDAETTFTRSLVYLWPSEELLPASALHFFSLENTAMHEDV